MKYLTCLFALLLACGDDSGATDSGPLDAGDDASSAADAGDDAAIADTGAVDAAATDAGDDAQEGDTYENFAADFMTTYCVDCHPGASGRRDYRTIDHIARDMDGIRCGVTPIALADCSGFPPPNQFPVGDGPKPTDEERTRLVQWIEAGLP